MGDNKNYSQYAQSKRVNNERSNTNQMEFQRMHSHRAITLSKVFFVRNMCTQLVFCWNAQYRFDRVGQIKKRLMTKTCIALPL